MKYLRLLRSLPTSEASVMLIFKCLLTLLIFYFGDTLVTASETSAYI